MFRTTTRKIAAGALAATALVSGFAFAIPSYAQDAETPTEVAAGPGVALRWQAGGPGEIRLGLPFGEGGDLFATFDTDGDGRVTQAEIDAARAAELETYDTNGDGVLSLEEYIALLTDQLRERLVDAFQHLDADGDGSITAEEFNVMSGIVARLDSNGDGALSDEDRPERDQTRPLERPGHGGPGGEDGPRGFIRGPIIIR
ncbi:MAG: EF-hand domain-containing protein [Bauldia sp.]|nr:EF-hand domain-containing protein [Bauldia sp.]